MTIGKIAFVCNDASMQLLAMWSSMIDSFKSKAEIVDQTQNMLT